MLQTIIYFLPCMVSLMWLFMFSLRKRSYTQQKFYILALIATFYFGSYAIYITPQTDYVWMARIDLVNSFLLLIFLAKVIIYLNCHLERRVLSLSWQHVLYIPATVMGTAVLTTYMIIGIDNIAGFTQYCDMLTRNGSNTFLNIDDYITNEFGSSSYKLYYIVDVIIFNVMIFIYSLGVLLMCCYLSKSQGYHFGDMFRFFFKNGKNTTIGRAISSFIILTLIFMTPLIVLGRSYTINHPYQGMAMSILVSGTIFVVAYVEYMSDIPVFSLKTIVNAELFTQRMMDFDDDPENVLEQESANMKQQRLILEAQKAAASSSPSQNSENTDAVSAEENYSPEIPDNTGETENQTSEKGEEENQILTVQNGTQTLEAALLNAFNVEKVFKDPSLSLPMLAAKLCTNRSNLSMIINKRYGLTFREVVNRYRVEAAKQYMLDNPTATQVNVAFECGYKDASALNHKFKEYEGVSPAMWLAQQRKG